MKTIHKIAAVVIQDNKFLMVRKADKDVWTSLGGKPEGDETEEEALMREIKEEIDCEGTVLEKLGDFEAKAVFDDAIVKLSTYLVELKGEIHLNDPELEEYRFLDKNYKQQGVNLPTSVGDQIIPFCIKRGLLMW